MGQEHVGPISIRDEGGGPKLEEKRHLRWCSAWWKSLALSGCRVCVHHCPGIWEELQHSFSVKMEGLLWKHSSLLSHFRKDRLVALYTFQNLKKK